MYEAGEISRVDDMSLPPWERGVRQGGNMNIEIMTKNLLDFDRILNSNNIEFVLFFGTLLGVVRQNGFILHDTDVDVLLSWEDYRKYLQVIPKLEDAGFTIIKDKPIHDEHIIRNGEKIECWWCGEVKDEFVYDTNIRFNMSLIFPLVSVNVFGARFLIPAQSNRILELLYGKDWGIPNTTKKGCGYKAGSHGY